MKYVASWYVVFIVEVVTWKTFGFALAHLTTSNSFAAASNNHSSLIASSSSNPRKLWNSINTLLERISFLDPLLPSIASSQSLSQMFATFFSDKILNLHSALKSSTISSSHIPPNHTPTILSSFALVSEDVVSKNISQSYISELDSYISHQTMPICTITNLD